jgi:hypothetical protein
MKETSREERMINFVALMGDFWSILERRVS